MRAAWRLSRVSINREEKPENAVGWCAAQNLPVFYSVRVSFQEFVCVSDRL
jgi:hypothetical protein